MSRSDYGDEVAAMVLALVQHLAGLPYDALPSHPAPRPATRRARTTAPRAVRAARPPRTPAPAKRPPTYAPVLQEPTAAFGTITLEEFRRTRGTPPKPTPPPAPWTAPRVTCGGRPSESAYTHKGCRCDGCRMANADAARRRRYTRRLRSDQPQRRTA